MKILILSLIQIFTVTISLASPKVVWMEKRSFFSEKFDERFFDVSSCRVYSSPLDSKDETNIRNILTLRGYELVIVDSSYISKTDNRGAYFISDSRNILSKIDKKESKPLVAQIYGELGMIFSFKVVSYDAFYGLQPMYGALDLFRDRNNNFELNHNSTASKNSRCREN